MSLSAIPNLDMLRLLNRPLNLNGKYDDNLVSRSLDALEYTRLFHDPSTHQNALSKPIWKEVLDLLHDFGII